MTQKQNMLASRGHRLKLSRLAVVSQVGKESALESLTPSLRGLNVSRIVQVERILEIHCRIHRHERTWRSGKFPIQRGGSRKQDFVEWDHGMNSGKGGCSIACG